MEREEIGIPAVLVSIVGGGTVIERLLSLVLIIVVVLIIVCTGVGSGAFIRRLLRKGQSSKYSNPLEDSFPTPRLLRNPTETTFDGDPQIEYNTYDLQCCGTVIPGMLQTFE